MGDAGSDAGVFDGVARGVDCCRARIWGVVVDTGAGACAGDGDICGGELGVEAAGFG